MEVQVIDCETSTSGKSIKTSVMFTVAYPEGQTDPKAFAQEFVEHLTKAVHERDEHSLDWLNLHMINVGDLDV